MFEQQRIDGDVVQFTMARKVFSKDLYKASCYFVDGLLIDTGISFFDHQLLENVSSLSLHTIVNTHCHEDHIGGNNLLQKQINPDIYAHLEAIPVIANPKLLYLRRYQKVFFGSPLPSKAKEIGSMVQTNRFNFKVIHTPGHSLDHISLLEYNKGWLICGDAFIGGKEKVLRSDYNIGEIVKTYRLILSQPINILFTGSGKVISKPDYMIKRKIEYIEEISEKVIILHNQGRNEKQIAQKLFGDDKLIRLVTNCHFSNLHLERSILSNESKL